MADQAITVSEPRLGFMFDALLEIESLSQVVRGLLGEQNLENVGSASCGMLIRIEQLVEAAHACLIPPDQGKSDVVLKHIVCGRAVPTIGGLS
ncbi:MAG: hypothetical protein IV107_03945 [Paucibacter sp.]|nr:hypothetical protein [Roseateles sp.]